MIGDRDKMLKQSLSAVGLAMCMLVGFAERCEAVVVSGTYSHTVANGIDNAGAFGTVGANLVNDVATGTFSYNTSLMPAFSGSGNYSSNLGNSTAGYLTVSLTINGHTVTFGGLANDVAESLNLQSDASSAHAELAIYIQGANGDYAQPWIALNPGFILTSDPAALSFSASSGNIYFPWTVDSFQIHTGSGVTTLTLTPTAMTASEGAIPEPATLTLLGAALVGTLGLRRRRVKSR